jgi:hypothetical protein
MQGVFSIIVSIFVSCFNQLELPLYESKDELAERLGKALEYRDGGNYLV